MKTHIDTNMFDGVPPEQFHQFMTPRNNTTTLHLPFPLHASNNNTTTFPTTFDPFHNPPPSNSHPHQLALLHHHHHKDHHDQDKDLNTTTTTLQPMNFEIETNQRQDDDPWTNDEVLALLRIRSSMDTWFPDLTWEHVSRKLAELGYKRTADKCKDKFEEETRYFHTNIHFNKTLEELYHLATERVDEGEDSRKRKDDDVAEKLKEQKKRKRVDKFEMFKGFCESIVHNMMAQQEEMHKKLIEDMMKRDEEKITREEEWKKQEMEKMNKELEMMAREQAIAGDRQANIIEFLKKFSETSPASNNNVKVITDNPKTSNPNPSSSISQDTMQVIPSSSSAPPVLLDTNDDTGRRWPKDEVLALINLRCANNVTSNNNNEEKEGNKAPLWERISLGMMELGYKRSAKRCKEKWENINKYFRKTKDNANNKKRSIHSRTCPYFHQLTTLYNHGKLVPQAHQSPDFNPSQLSHSHSQLAASGAHKTLMQQPSLDFDHF